MSKKKSDGNGRVGDPAEEALKARQLLTKLHSDKIKLCGQEVNEVCKRHNCRLEAKMIFVGGQPPITEIVIVPLPEN